MHELTIHPSTPEQRLHGWDESFEWADRSWPGCWELRTTSNVYAVGAVRAEVCPVYWEKGLDAGIHWWVRVHEDAAPSSWILSAAQSEWFRLPSLAALHDLIGQWQWEESHHAHVAHQTKSMHTAEEQWRARVGSLDEMQHNVLVPAPTPLDQWGVASYTPTILQHAEADLYHHVADTFGAGQPLSKAVRL